MLPNSSISDPKATRGEKAYVHNAERSFRVHHYVGSLESNPWRAKIYFDERNQQKHITVDNSTPRYSTEDNSSWLTQFTKLVGKDKALKLTQNSRIRAQKEMERVINNRVGRWNISS